MDDEVMVGLLEGVVVGVGARDVAYEKLYMRQCVRDVAH